MSTPFSDVYGFFTRKVTDHSFLAMTPQELEDILFELMQSAAIKFKSCKQSLSDRTTTQFNVTLTEEEKEIIGTWMVAEWLTSRVNNTQHLNMVMSDKDFRWSSQAQHLKELKDLRNTMIEEAYDLVTLYHFDDATLEELR